MITRLFRKVLARLFATPTRAFSQASGDPCSVSSSDSSAPRYAALELLRACKADPRAKCMYDVLRGGLKWSDETPPGDGCPAFEVVCRLVAHRATITVDGAARPGDELWTEARRVAPNWPGFDPRRSGAADRRLLRMIKRHEPECILEFERSLDLIDAQDQTTRGSTVR
jgi:hypothetical protein